MRSSEVPGQKPGMGWVGVVAGSQVRGQDALGGEADFAFLNDVALLGAASGLGAISRGMGHAQLADGLAGDDAEEDFDQVQPGA